MLLLLGLNVVLVGSLLLSFFAFHKHSVTGYLGQRIKMHLKFSVAHGPYRVPSSPSLRRVQNMRVIAIRALKGRIWKPSASGCCRQTPIRPAPFHVLELFNVEAFHDGYVGCWLVFALNSASSSASSF
jgi:hypothetical protein